MEETPESDKIVVYNKKGEEILIDNGIMDTVLYYLSNHKFQLKDFSQFKTEKEILEYYYNQERECVGYMELNFQQEKDMQEFFMKFTKEVVVEKYNNNQQISNFKNKIDLGFSKIIEKYKTNDNLDINDLQKYYYEIFKTNKIPKFLENNLLEEIKSIQLIKEINQKNDNIYKIDAKIKTKNEELINYYKKIVSGEMKPFITGDKTILFNIFLYSNLKDIYKNYKIKNIILSNYYEISRCFLNNWDNIDEFQNEINNKKGIDYIEDKLIETFSKYEVNESHIYILASYFYLVMNEIKDTRINDNDLIKFNQKSINISNPLLNKILRNTIMSFYKYCQVEGNKYDSYISMINYFNDYIIVNGTGEKINKFYDYSEIESKIIQAKINGLNNCFDYFKEEIKQQKNSNIISKILNKKANNFFNYKDFDSSLIKLIPLTKNRHSNTITILISGFLSEKDDINEWGYFYNYDRHSNYYLYRWPAHDILSFVLKSVLFIFNAAFLFIKCKKIAKYAGRILARFLASNDDFKNCQINLAGFSLGGQVVKYCIKELNAIKGHKVMINNALFLGGAADMRDNKKDKWRNIFRDNVGGRVINCFSRYDWVLKNLYKICAKNDPNINGKKDPIGLNKMNIKDEKGEYYIVEDYDLSDLKLGHIEYRGKFFEILKRINFLNSN